MGFFDREKDDSNCKERNSDRVNRRRFVVHEAQEHWSA